LNLVPDSDLIMELCTIEIVPKLLTSEII